MKTLFRLLAGILGVLTVAAGGFTLLVAALLLVLPGLCKIEASSSSGSVFESGGIAALLISGVLLGVSWLLIRWSAGA